MYNGFLLRGNKQGSQTALSNGNTSNNARPSSAGTNRGRSGSFGSVRVSGPPLSTSNNTPGLGQHIYTNPSNTSTNGSENTTGSNLINQNHRPSSAGHSRPMVNNAQIKTDPNAAYVDKQPHPVAGIYVSHATENANIVQQTTTGYARPKSAGTQRRNENAPAQVTNEMYGNSQNGGQTLYIPQQQIQQQKLQQQQQQFLLLQQQQLLEQQQMRQKKSIMTEYPSSGNPSSAAMQAPQISDQTNGNHSNQYNYYGAGSILPTASLVHSAGQNPGGLVRPLSANATSQTSSRNYAAATIASSNHFIPSLMGTKQQPQQIITGNGANNPVNPLAYLGTVNTGVTNTAPPNTNTVNHDTNPVGNTIKHVVNIPSANRPTTSVTYNKLRTAVDLSYRYTEEDAETANRIADGTYQTNVNVNKVSNPVGAVSDQMFDEEGIDEDDGDDIGLDAMELQNSRANSQIRQNVRKANSSAKSKATSGGNADEDDEMDGKRVVVSVVGDSQSRTHPEVSTASQSLELIAGASGSTGLHGVSSGVVDARNASLDSFSEENILIGLSTVPNQFCTKRDALELKKLLMLSIGTRGGIVPSSSAVMDMYMVGKVVGVGSYGKVRAAWHRLTGSKVAIKTYDKSKLKDPAHWKRVHSEIQIMEQVSHPRIARMYEAVETPKRMHLIMECLDGGNLCSYVKAKRRLSEEESKRIFFQILQAIDHLHLVGVSHRDVKLENVLFENDKDIKLIDFGFSTVCQPGKKLKVFCGTPSYMAPEIVRRSEYEGKPVDVWSMGILLYALLCGCFPFRAKAYPDLYRRIARGTFAIPDELSAHVKDLLRQLLTVDANLRITAHAALRHAWLQTQLINAPNIDKLRQEIPILISDKPADDLDDQVIGELTSFGMAKDELIRLVMTKTHSSLATLYYLLLDTLISRRKVAAAATNHRKSMQGYHHGGGAIANGGSGTTQSKDNRVKQSSALHNVVNTSNGQQTGPLTGTQVISGAAATIAGVMGGILKGRMSGIVTSNENQQAAVQQEANQQQQTDRQEYRYRPKSASMNRSGSTGQRPFSAFVSRR